jgi:soluble lytic murein transglycosylase-like protein
MARRVVVLLAWCACSLAHADCFDRAAARFNTNPDLLRAIAEQESLNRADAIGPLLADGNRAVGTMQVNTVHLPELAKYGVTKNDLMTQCGSVFVGAWIFARYARRFGYTWEAVGIYNTGPDSKNSSARAKYIEAVRRRFERIQRARARPAQGPVRLASRMAVWGND